MAGSLKVAPKQLIQKDFRQLDDRTTLASTWDMERTLLEVTVASHAHEGHGAFDGARYVDTTEDHVARAMDRNPAAEKRLRQYWIQQIRAYAEAAISGNAPRNAVGDDRMPLCGIGLLRWIEVEPRDVLKGLLLGGMRDKPAWRRKAQEKYGIEIGYGQMHPVDLRRMAEAGLNGEMLARQPHEADLETLEKQGVILPQDTPTDENIHSMYVRYQTGPGASDDAAILSVGRLYGIGAAVGCFLADATDTLEKYTEVVTDQDNEIARLVQEHAPGLGVSDDEIVRVVYLAATPAYMVDTLPDSSMREMLQLDRSVDQSLLESHFLWLTGRPWRRMAMGPDPKLDNVALYQYVEDRLKEAGA